MRFLIDFVIVVLGVLIGIQVPTGTRPAIRSVEHHCCSGFTPELGELLAITREELRVHRDAWRRL